MMPLWPIDFIIAKRIRRLGPGGSIPIHQIFNWMTGYRCEASRMKAGLYRIYITSHVIGEHRATNLDTWLVKRYEGCGAVDIRALK